MVKVMPWAAIGFIIGGLVSMGMPGFSGFVAEFPIFLGVWQKDWYGPIAAIIAIISIVITAAYILLNIRKVFFGDMPANLEGHISPITALDKVAIATLCFLMVALGLFPWLMVPMVQTGVQHILALLGGA
jgi:NADH-quinone oxidoreductase subunit M